MKESLEDPLAIHLLLKFFNIYSPRRGCRLLFSTLPVPLLVMVAWVDKDIQTADGGKEERTGDQMIMINDSNLSLAHVQQ